MLTGATLQRTRRQQQFRGGPAWYMARGLGMRWMGVLFSVFLLMAYGLLFNTIQANSVAHAVHFAWQLMRVAPVLRWR
jgi:AGCS family alanine or glycine:cation symporter